MSEETEDRWEKVNWERLESLLLDTLPSGTAAAANSGSLCCRLPLFPSGRKVGPLEKPSCRYYTSLLYIHFSSTTTLDRSWCSASHPWTFTHSVLKDALCAARVGRLFHYREIKDWWPTYLLLVTSLLLTAASLQPACSALFQHRFSLTLKVKSRYVQTFPGSAVTSIMSAVWVFVESWIIQLLCLGLTLGVRTGGNPHLTGSLPPGGQETPVSHRITHEAKQRQKVKNILNWFKKYKVSPADKCILFKHEWRQWKLFKNANPQIVISQHQQKWTLVNTDNNNLGLWGRPLKFKFSLSAGSPLSTLHVENLTWQWTAV